MYTIEFNGTIYASLSLANDPTPYIGHGKTTHEAIQDALTTAILYS